MINNIHPLHRIGQSPLSITCLVTVVTQWAVILSIYCLENSVQKSLVNVARLWIICLPMSSKFCCLKHCALEHLSNTSLLSYLLTRFIFTLYAICQKYHTSSFKRVVTKCTTFFNMQNSMFCPHSSESQNTQEITSLNCIKILIFVIERWHVLCQVETNFFNIL